MQPALVLGIQYRERVGTGVILPDKILCQQQRCSLGGGVPHVRRFGS